MYPTCYVLLFFWLKTANFSNVWVDEWWATHLLKMNYWMLPYLWCTPDSFMVTTVITIKWQNQHEQWIFQTSALGDLLDNSFSALPRPAWNLSVSFEIPIWCWFKNLKIVSIFVTILSTLVNAYFKELNIKR